MPFDIQDFHFIRPLVLLLLIPVMALLFIASNQRKNQSNWKNVISPHLLQYLFVSGEQPIKKTSIWIAGLFSLTAIVAASGPSFRQKSVPVFQAEQAQVILLDLSLSMNATDITPSRLERAKFKLLDLLDRTNEGSIGLVIYAGDAFVISPLTSDSNTISNMVPTLATNIMPVLGSRPDIGISKAFELLANAKHSTGEVIWITDGVESQHVDAIISATANSPYQLSILAVGTEQGSPIPLPDNNGFLKDRNGAIVVPKLNLNLLNQIASDTKSGIVKLTADNSDLEYLKRHQEWQSNQNEIDESNEQKISRWIDDGYWLTIPLLILFFINLLKQPKGQFFSHIAPLLLFTGIFSSPSSQAFEWIDLWKTKNQQAQKAFAEQDFETATRLFEQNEWKATSQYRQGNYSQAAENFALNGSLEQATSKYNQATSLAKNNQLQEALDLYNELLQDNPEHEDANFNKKLIEDLIKQQQQNQEQNDQQEQDQRSQEQNSQEQNSQEQNAENQESEESKESEQQQNQQSENEAQGNEPLEEKSLEEQQKEMQISEDEREKSEKDQALKHWLEKIPDDPGGLLRRKMYREYQKRGRQQTEKKHW